MSEKLAWHSELEPLAAALCDGELAASELARLEQLLSTSAEARRFLVQYLQLHGELYWEQAASAAEGRHAVPAAIVDTAAGFPGREEPACTSASMIGQGTPAVSVPATASDRSARLPQASHPASVRARGSLIGRRLAPALWTLAAAAAVLVAVALIGQAVLPTAPVPGPARPVAEVATVGRLVGARWIDPAEGAVSGERLVPGRTLRLRHGLVELQLDGGARLIVQGPAEFTVVDGASGKLSEGVLTARAGNGERPLRIETPLGTVIDRGTEFGVAVQPSGVCEVHVFEGAVELLARDVPSQSAGTRATMLRAGQAVCVRSSDGAGALQVEPVPFGLRRYVRRLPKAGSVAAMRAVVAGEPHLVHHYPFEGNTREQILRDTEGHLDLMPVVMLGGRGAGSIACVAEGFDSTSNAVQPFRAQGEGNRVGVGLQSEDPFVPPKEMTVEVLFCYDGMQPAADGPVAVAVGTRADAKRCGFFLAAAGRGQLTHLMDADAPWTESSLQLVPGHWYYVAATFLTRGDHTQIDVYAADLTEGENRLRCVLSDAVCPGTPVAGPLGIGKGFQQDVAHAYPWPGRLDEVAIYDRLLDPDTLQRHLDALIR